VAVLAGTVPAQLGVELTAEELRATEMAPAE
jgi:hypothetical protein